MKSPRPRAASQLAALAWILTAVVWGAGCGSSRGAKPPRTGPAYSYVLRMDDSLAGAEFQLDVLPVNSSTYARFGEAPVSDYFKPGSDIRPSVSSALGRYVFSNSKREARLELKRNPALKKYRYPGYSHVAIFADIPVAFSGGRNDPRRLLLPLDPNKWPRKWSGEKYLITVTISRDGLQPDPIPSVPD